MSFRFNPAEKPRFFVIDLDQNRRVLHLVREVREMLLSEYYDDQGGPLYNSLSHRMMGHKDN